jgi:multiple antibiotic resistance protein
MLDYTLLCFASFFSLINPLGVIPTFNKFTESFSKAQKKKVALTASATMFIGIMLFAFLGDYIFKFFGVSIHALRVVGGILLLEMGRDLLHGTPPKMKSAENLHDVHIGIVPFGFPILCGAGAITTGMVMKNLANTTDLTLIFIAIVLLISIITLISLNSAMGISRRIGVNGQSIINRLMGLITMIIAVEFIFKGIKPILIQIGKEIIK